VCLSSPRIILASLASPDAIRTLGTGEQQLVPKEIASRMKHVWIVSQQEVQDLEPRDFELRLHHIGFVVRRIEKQAQDVADSTLSSWDAKIFHDPLQKVRVTFLQAPRPGDAQIELLEPAADDSPIQKFLEKGGGLHHLCYEVPDLDAHLKRVLHQRAGGALLVKPPLPAVAFENRRIAWIYTRQKLLLEFLEQKNITSPASVA
jgi:methylmalonyl-CoA/ethylmalonyl-CoA epimerase